IDARDLADWCVHIAEKKLVGVFNAIGEKQQLGKVLSKMNKTLGNKSTFKWVSENFLRSHGVSCWTELPLWVFDEIDIFVSWDSKKAIQNGLKFRPLEDTTLDTFDWVKDIRLQSLSFSSMLPERESELLEMFD